MARNFVRPHPSHRPRDFPPYMLGKNKNFWANFCSKILKRRHICPLTRNFARKQFNIYFSPSEIPNTSQLVSYQTLFTNMFANVQISQYRPIFENSPRAVRPKTINSFHTPPRDPCLKFIPGPVPKNNTMQVVKIQVWKSPTVQPIDTLDSVKARDSPRSFLATPPTKSWPITSSPTPPWFDPTL